LSDDSKGESGGEPGGEVVPLRIINGDGIPAGAKVLYEQRPLPVDFIREVIQLNDQSRNLLFEIGQVEAQLLEIAGKKIDLYRQYREIQDKMMGQAKQAARKVGIDPDDDSKAWILNLDTHAFVRTK